MQKRIMVPEIGEVILQKRKGARSVRLTVSHDGTLRVSMPTWSPYAVGEGFARSKVAWIKKHQKNKRQHVFGSGERIGKAHRLRTYHERRTTIATRVLTTEITIRIPAELTSDDKKVQAAIQKAAVRALKQEAKQLLPSRLEGLAKAHGFSYKRVDIKLLKSRWGSCNTQKEIALNCYLMQLPWDLIDYVLLHELMHTRIMAHGPLFWDELSQYVSDLPAKRKAIRSHQPTLIPQG
jgi:hypothetical protein